MSKEFIKRLATKDDEIVKITVPVSELGLTLRNQLYSTLPPEEFGKKFKNGWHKPVSLSYLGKTYEIQANVCVNPYCRWFGMEQEQFNDIKYQPSRYRIAGRNNNSNNESSFNCRPDPYNTPDPLTVKKDTATIYSNWSLAEEISRLVKINTIFDKKKDFCFHKDNCQFPLVTPFNEMEHFYKYGFSKANSPRYKCKTCGKVTTTIPQVNAAFNYDQNKDGILPKLAKLVTSRVPVRKTMQLLNISPSTYYHKLEQLYKCSLEFLAKHEQKALAEKEFDELWLNSDSLEYRLNPLRKKLTKGSEDLITHVLVTADMKSRYVFRADVNFDYFITLDEIERDTVTYFEDHLYLYSRKNARLRISPAPQQPAAEDTQEQESYDIELEEFERRRDRFDGVHVTRSYTAYAHYWLVNQMLNFKKLRIITDKDPSLLTTLNRVFANSMKSGDTHHFLCKLNKDKSRQDAMLEYMAGDKEEPILRSIVNLRRSKKSEANQKSLELAYSYLFKRVQDSLEYSTFKLPIAGFLEEGQQRAYMNVELPLFKHPIPTRDGGYYDVGITTNVNSLSPSAITEMLLKVNSRPTDAFFQQLRRSINILERPILGAKPDAKSYVFANLNPKYAQYAATIMRAYYNFCKPIKFGKASAKTPAQHLGIAKKQYTIEDILYCR